MTASGCGKLVMIVEDDRDVREAVAEVLTDCGYHTIEAANGEEALMWLRVIDLSPCLILLDIMMPIMDGWQFRAAQRSEPALAAIPVVVLTAHGSPQETARAMDAAGFLRKPVQLDALLQMVDRLCQRERGS
jgi:CheY-like chemotaxis protein